MDNRIERLGVVKWRDMQPLQPNNAKRIINYDDISDSIDKYGFAMPFYVWEKDGVAYTIDGHTRKEVLSNKNGVPDELPAVFVKAKNRKEAVKILIEVYNQKHNPFDRDVLVEMITQEEIAIDEIAVDSVNVFSEAPQKENNEQENRLGIYPLSIVLNAVEYKNFQLYKSENRVKTDTEAFKILFEMKKALE